MRRMIVWARERGEHIAHKQSPWLSHLDYHQVLERYEKSRKVKHQRVGIRNMLDYLSVPIHRMCPGMEERADGGHQNGLEDGAPVKAPPEPLQMYMPLLAGPSRLFADATV